MIELGEHMSTPQQELTDLLEAANHLAIHAQTATERTHLRGDYEFRLHYGIEPDLVTQSQEYYAAHLAAALAASELGYQETADWHLNLANGRRTPFGRTISFASLEGEDRDIELSDASFFTSDKAISVSRYLASKIENPATAFEAYERLYRAGDAQSFDTLFEILDEQVESSEIGRPDIAISLLYRLGSLIQYAWQNRDKSLPDLVKIFRTIEEKLDSYNPTVIEQLSKTHMTYYDRPTLEDFYKY
jgi:hypothetical protein